MPGLRTGPRGPGDLSLPCPALPGATPLFGPSLEKRDSGPKAKAPGGWELGRSHPSRLSVQPARWKTSCHRESEPNGRQPRPSRVWHRSRAARTGAAAAAAGIYLCSPPRIATTRPVPKAQSRRVTPRVPAAMVAAGELKAERETHDQPPLALPEKDRERKGNWARRAGAGQGGPGALPGPCRPPPPSMRGRRAHVRDGGASAVVPSKPWRCRGPGKRGNGASGSCGCGQN